LEIQQKYINYPDIVTMAMTPFFNAKFYGKILMFLEMLLESKRRPGLFGE